MQVGKHSLTAKDDRDREKSRVSFDIGTASKTQARWDEGERESFLEENKE